MPWPTSLVERDGKPPCGTGTNLRMVLEAGAPPRAPRFRVRRPDHPLGNGAATKKASPSIDTCTPASTWLGADDRRNERAQELGAPQPRSGSQTAKPGRAHRAEARAQAENLSRATVGRFLVHGRSFEPAVDRQRCGLRVRLRLRSRDLGRTRSLVGGRWSGC